MSRATDLELFSAIAKSGSLSEAARRLGLTAGAVSRRLAALETRLGCPLVLRNTRGMALTGEGKRFLAGADDILERIAALEDAVTSARGSLKGKLRINCSWGFGERVLSLAAAEFAAENPEIELTLLLSDPPLDPVQSGLDLVIHIGELPESRFHAKRLFRNDRILCASPSLLQKTGGSVTSPADLAKLPAISIDEDRLPGNIWELKGKNGAVRIRFQSTLRTNSSGTATRWAEAGLGVILRSRWAVSDALQSGKLTQILPDLTMPSSGYAYYAGNRLASPARSFLRFLVPWLKQRGIAS